jgi:protein-tyrosine-phosphatase
MMRSQMAEAFYNNASGTHDATSAGAIATGDDHISERARDAMDEIGVTTEGQYSKQLTPGILEKADVVVLFPTDFMPDYAKNSPKAITWDVIDPHYHHEEGMELVRRVRDQILENVQKLLL